MILIEINYLIYDKKNTGYYTSFKGLKARVKEYINLNTDRFKS